MLVQGHDYRKCGPKYIWLQGRSGVAILVFFEDYAGPYPLTFDHSTVYARQFDIEGGYPTFTNSIGWLFGYKTESGSGCGAATNPCPTLLTASGGSIEVIGAAHYLNKNTGESRPSIPSPIPRSALQASIVLAVGIRQSAQQDLV